jgi:hypothetical protein
MAEALMDTNEDQTLTLDGRFRFQEVTKALSHFTGVSDCTGCKLVGTMEMAPPCSPGARKDRKRGIWVAAK